MFSCSVAVYASIDLDPRCTKAASFVHVGPLIGIGPAECLGRSENVKQSLFGSELARVGPFQIVEDPGYVLDEKPVLIRHLEVNPHWRCNNPTVAGKPLARSDLDSYTRDTQIDHAGSDRVKLNFVPWAKPSQHGVDDLTNWGSC